MYDQFYGLSGKPFQLTPDPAFYFESTTHRKAMSYLGYGLAQGEGLIVITGEIGAGKSTLVAHLMDTIDDRRLTAAQIVSTQVEGDDLIRLVAQRFGIDSEGRDKAELLREIEAFLHDQARAGKRTLLIVDEAQNLPLSALEELRMFSNFQLGAQPLMQIFLLGQPEFRDTFLDSPSLEQLRQRVIATHHLDAMDEDEIEPYILHRLAKVGWDGNPTFTAGAMAEIYAASSGIPRKVNTIAARVMLQGAVDQASKVDGDMVREVVAEMESDAREGAGSAVTPAVPHAVAARPASRAAIAAVPSAPADDAAYRSEIAAMAAQIETLEHRLAAQDGELRRVLALMIDWLDKDRERDEGAARQTRAA